MPLSIFNKSLKTVNAAFHRKIILLICVRLHPSDLRNMYILLSPLEEGLETLLEEWEEHLSNVALAVMQSLQGENVRDLLLFFY